jgi:hypothetical protein
MGYTIEISFDIHAINNFTQTKHMLNAIAEENNCDDTYFMHEIEGQGKTIERNHCIFVTIFEIEQIKDIMNYLRNIRNDTNYYIECIYRDDGVYHILHASPIYLKRMNKNYVKQYKKNRKTNKLSEEELLILNAIKKR